MIASFKEFIDNILYENLHPELQNIINSVDSYKSKQSQIAFKIKDLTDRGENTGTEGNMPKGSSRAYLKHTENHHALVDGKPASFSVGTKVAIKSSLDNYHKKSNHSGLSLGQLQNRDENDDSFTDNYRILHKDHEGNFSTNHKTGIFPPLVEHDSANHNWSTVGHSRDIKAGEFQKLTKTKSHPKGITHKDFVEAMIRNHNKENGRYWENGRDHESKMDHISSHPLVQKFIDYHNSTGNPPHDYSQKKNMGIFEHPDGSQHIVARDHGFSTEVSESYQNARKRKYFNI